MGAFHPWTRRLIAFGLFIVLAYLGLEARLWMWDTTKTVRFNFDLDNAWRNASDAIALGKGNVFDGIVKKYETSAIDYPPIRMYIKTAWVMWEQEHYGAIRPSWERGTRAVRRDDNVWPMLVVNYVFELAGALGMYFLCRLYRGRFLALLAACALWFNPAVIYNTFGWPQWDGWAIAPLIWGAWALLRRGTWRSTLITDVLMGALLALAPLLKGQALVVLPWYAVVLVGVTLLNARPFGMVIKRWWLRWSLKVAHLVVRVALAGFAAWIVVTVVARPFTVRHSEAWKNVYSREADRDQPMGISGFNVPEVLRGRYRWDSSGETWTASVGDQNWTYTLQEWLRGLFAVWMGVIAFLSLRGRRRPEILLGLAACWAAFFAVIPGMHERYVLWAAAFGAPAVCVGFSATLIYAAITFLAFANQIYYVLGNDPTFLPALRTFLERRQTQMDLGWWWFACALGLTWCMAMARGATWVRVRRIGYRVGRWGRGRLVRWGVVG
jgi:hypothetical protein